MCVTKYFFNRFNWFEMNKNMQERLLNEKRMTKKTFQKFAMVTVMMDQVESGRGIVAT